MTAENGVANVIRGVLDMGGGDSEDNMDWQKVRYRYRRGGNCKKNLFTFIVVTALEAFFWYYIGSNKLEIKGMRGDFSI